MTDIVWSGPDGLRPLLVPLERLSLLPGNPRRGDVEAVAASLAEFGQRKNIVARRPPHDTPGDLTIETTEAGNHVVQAATSLGWTHVAVVFVTEDEQTGNRYALADNRTHDLGYDDLGDLYAMLDGLSTDELLAGTGWTGDDVSALRSELYPSETRLTGSVTTPVPQSLWPVVRLLLEPDIHKLWMKLWIDLPGDTDTEKAHEIVAKFGSTEEKP